MAMLSHRDCHCLTSGGPFYSPMAMILKANYFYKEQSVFMSRLDRRVVASWSMFEFGNCVLYLHHSASEICTPICSWLKTPGDAMVLWLRFGNNYEQSRNYTSAHIWIFIKGCTRRLSIKIRLFTYTATLTKPACQITFWHSTSDP